MKIKSSGYRQILYLLFIAFLSLSFNWNEASLKESQNPTLLIKPEWVIDTLEEKTLKPHLIHNSPPLLSSSLVIQAHANGVKAYNKKNTERVWSFAVPFGVASPLVLYKKNIYFGGADGFFYSLRVDTGRLNWKFWTGSENSGTPLIQKGKIYWLANNQKLYAANLKGSLLWIYSGPSLPKSFFVRGHLRPAIYKNSIFVGFYQGSLMALDKHTGKLKWKRSLSSQAIREDLEINGNCLLVPVFNSHLFCLNPLNGKIRWKFQGGSSVFLSERKVLYHWRKKELRAFKRNTQKTIWTKRMKQEVWPFSPRPFKKYLVYGFSDLGKLVFVNAKNGKTVKEYKFGKGLAAPVTVDLKNRHIYFMSITGYLHKISLH